jgi:hypothetical protein
MSVPDTARWSFRTIHYTSTAIAITSELTYQSIHNTIPDNYSGIVLLIKFYFVGFNLCFTCLLSIDKHSIKPNTKYLIISMDTQQM